VEPAYADSGNVPRIRLAAGTAAQRSPLVWVKHMNNSFLMPLSALIFSREHLFENSPLVKRETSIMSGISVSWIFFKSAKTVTVEK